MDPAPLLTMLLVESPSPDGWRPGPGFYVIPVLLGAVFVIGSIVNNRRMTRRITCSACRNVMKVTNAAPGMETRCVVCGTVRIITTEDLGRGAGSRSGSPDMKPAMDPRELRRYDVIKCPGCGWVSAFQSETDCPSCGRLLRRTCSNCGYDYGIHRKSCPGCGKG